LRSSDVKIAIEAGCDCSQLHAKLSLHALHTSGTSALVHSATGPCHTCEVQYPLEYAAFKPKTGGKGGRPPKRKQQKRASSGTRVRSR
jgi:hypothetical protein